MKSSILVVNAGSSSLKLRCLDEQDAVIARHDLHADEGRFDPAEVARFLGAVGAVDAVGHRVVHGGEQFPGPVRLTPDVRQRLEALVDLAPLHQPFSLQAIDAVTRALPAVPAVACFDTAFHATLPEAASTYAVPREWRQRWAVRRYGFHGLSHAYASRRAAEMVGGERRPLRVVTCHLGAGASLAAVRDGACLDTTMGFTPLEGLVMATRSGTVDPGLVLWLQQHRGLTAAQIGDALERHSGLLALAGTADMREVLAQAGKGGAGDPVARLAIDVYVHRLRAGIAAMTAALGGLDVLVFTGGVGENAAEIRQRAGHGLAFLGVAIDEAANAAASGDTDISSLGTSGARSGQHQPGEPDSGEMARLVETRVRTLVIDAREDVEMARQVRHVLAGVPESLPL